eukprot:5494910-Alexandrium_andersonii.AAC.1
MSHPSLPRGGLWIATPHHPKSRSQANTSSAFHCGASLTRHRADASASRSTTYPTTPSTSPSPLRLTSPPQLSSRKFRARWR